jgi:hypothetical protein
MLLCSIISSISLALTPPDITEPVQSTFYNKSDAIIVIGNEAYYSLPQSIFSEKDADLFQKYGKHTLYFSSWKQASIKNTDVKNIRKHISKYSLRVRRNGTLWIYYSGHGYTNKYGNRALVGIDATTSTLEENSIGLNEIIEIAREKKRVSRIVIIADCGFGNIGKDGFDVFGDYTPKEPTPLPYSDENVIIWVPNQGIEGSPSFSLAQQGLFSYLVAGSLRGWADGSLNGEKDGILTMGEAQAYVQQNIVLLGWPLKPSLHEKEETQDWIIRDNRLEEAPQSETFTLLSKDMRARRFSEAEMYLQAQASDMWRDVMYDVQKGGPDGEEALKRFLQEYEYKTIDLSWAPNIPQIIEAQRLLREYEKEGNVKIVDIGDCENLMEMEAKAMMGEISDAEIACLESKIRLNRKQSERANISRILINNANQRQDYANWESLMRRHLERFDRSDPDLTWSMTVYLYNKGKENYGEAIKWAENTVENRQRWESGDQYVENSYNLFKIRAIISTQLWIESETIYRKDRNPETEAYTEEMRGFAKEHAREWLDYARASQQPTKQAFDMCVSAAGDSDFCLQ